VKSIKDVRTKSLNIDPSLLVRSGSTPHLPLSVRTHHKFRKIRRVLHQQVRTSTSEEHPSPPIRKIPALDEPLPSDCGRPLWTALTIITRQTKSTLYLRILSGNTNSRRW